MQQSLPFQRHLLAKETGCQLLYLDPGWEICEGTTLWDEKRLGKVENFINTIKKKYGLETGFRTIGRVYRDEFPEDWYIKRLEKPKEGKLLPYWEPCTQYRKWKKDESITNTATLASFQ